MKDSIDRTFGVIDENFTVIACSELGKIGETVEGLNLTGTELVVSEGMSFKSIGATQGPNYIVFVDGDDILASKYVSVLSVAFANIKFYYDEK